MKRMILVLAVVGLAIGAVASGAKVVKAEECITENGIVVPRFRSCQPHAEGGGDMPVPFGLNAKAELADGEAYILWGKVIIQPKKGGSMDPRVQFEVDLHEHPWLANTKRIANPYYPLEGSVTTWKKQAGDRIKLACRAHGRIMNFGRGPEYVISLEGTQNVGDSR